MHGLGGARRAEWPKELPQILGERAPTAQLLGLFMGRHVFIIGFTILVLFFLCRPILRRQDRAAHSCPRRDTSGFVWALMGCLGGFEVFGLEGLVIGLVLLTLMRELWEQRVRDLDLANITDRTSPVDHGI